MLQNDFQFLLSAFDASMMGEPLTRDQETARDIVGVAMSFGAAAYDGVPDANAAAVAYGRAFLMALIDPLHPGLDYLRADPSSGATGRVKRKASAS